MSDVGRTQDAAGLDAEQPGKERPENGATANNGHQAVVRSDHSQDDPPRGGRALRNGVVIAPLIVVEAIWLAALVVILVRVL